jgi:Transposase domain (DUF772)
VGLLALALLLQAYCNVGDRDAVELTVLDKRWQMVLDCLGAEQPPFSQGTLFNFRMRLMAHNLDKTLLDRTVALAEKTGGFGARQLRAALDSTPLCGACRVEDTLNLLGHALRKAVGLVAQALGTSTNVLLEEAGLTLVGHSSLKAVLDLRWGKPGAREKALRLVLEEVDRWKRWLEQHQSLPEPESPLQAVMDTIVQIVEQDTEPDPEGGKPRHDLRYASASLSRLGIVRANPRLATPVFSPTLGPCTTLCSVIHRRRHHMSASSQRALGAPSFRRSGARQKALTARCARRLRAAAQPGGATRSSSPAACAPAVRPGPDATQTGWDTIARGGGG